ncbi:hypothetical protein PAEH1_02635 [Paenalcaligenes hominis]|uniref:Lipoprotein SmpA/OmlA domain-containing protein n=1 Tax=Paenalcaligenes hominis TaxID=643674 RepID=A0A1U9JY41_9BURK|nr:hypothetical protein PAEH1_02635 [Paenalcaligenes hominis]
MRVLAVLAITAALYGCASTYGSPITVSQIDSLVVGETTIENAVEIFGKPVTETENSDGTKVVSWGYAKSSLGSPLESQGLSIVFDREGKLSSFSKSNYSSAL